VEGFHAVEAGEVAPALIAMAVEFFLGQDIAAALGER
jgi:hypothetical protein